MNPVTTMIKHLLSMVFGITVGYVSVNFAHNLMINYSKVEVEKLHIFSLSTTSTVREQVAPVSLPEAPIHATQVTQTPIQQFLPPEVLTHSEAEQSYNYYIARSKSKLAIYEYSQQHGVSTDEAKRRLQREGPLDIALDTIIQLEGEKIAGWGIDHENDFRAWITLVGGSQLSEESQSVLSKNQDIDIYDYALYPLAELEQALEEIYSYEYGGMSASMPVEQLNDAILKADVDMRKNILEIQLNEDVPSYWTSKEAMFNDIYNHFSLTLNVPFELVFTNNVT